MKKAVPFLLILLFFALNIEAQTLYSVKFPNDTTLVGCGAKSDTIFPQIVKQGNCSFAVGVSVTDQVFSLNSAGQCSKILRRYRIVWWCGYDPNSTPLTTIPNPSNTDQGPTALGTVQNHGNLEYTQVIKILDDNKPMFLDCPGDITVCDYSPNNPLQYNDGHTDQCEAPVQLRTEVVDACSGSDIVLRYLIYLDMDNNGTMERTVSSSDAGAWPIIRQASGDTLRASVDFSPNIELPYGKHAIQWIARDNCGNQSYCKYNFLIKDCLNPTVVCKNGISVNIMQTGMVSLPLSAILEYTSDNCTPVSQLKTAVQHHNAGTVFPTGQVSVNFDCNQLGPQLVEVWSQDAAGNDDYCIATVTIQDNMGNCSNAVNRPGQLTDLNGKPLSNVVLRLRSLGSNTADWTTTSTAKGYFDFGQVPACGLALELQLPASNKAVRSLDALALARHLLDLEKIQNPYLLLAADVNHDLTLTDADVDALIQHILQKNASTADWMVMPKGHIMAANPFVTPLPDMLNLAACVAALPDSLMLQIAPMADVDASWNKSDQKTGKSDDTMPLRYDDKVFEKGDVVAVEFYMPSMDGIPAFELALYYDRNTLSLTAKQGGVVPETWMFSQNYRGLFACAWQEPSLVAPSAKGGQLMAFRLVFKAEKAGKLSEVLSLNADYFTPLAYKTNRDEMAITLEASPVLQRAAKTSIGLSAYPNPSKGQTKCSLILENEEAVQLWLSDLYGNSRLLSDQVLAQGVYSFDVLDLRSGIYFVRAATASRTKVLRLVVE